MRVRLTTDRALSGLVQYAGSVVDVPEPDARRLLATRQAEAVTDHQPDPKPARDKTHGRHHRR